jgi:hypothetical protein
MTDEEIRTELDRQAKLQSESAIRQTDEAPDYDRIESLMQTQLLQKIANDLHLVYLVVLWGIIVAFAVGVFSIVRGCAAVM